MLQPGWEGSLGENGYMHMYGWVPLLFTWNNHNSVNCLHTPIQKKKFKIWGKKKEVKKGTKGVWERIFAIYVPNERITPRTPKEILQVNNKKTNTQLKKYFNRHSWQGQGASGRSVSLWEIVRQFLHKHLPSDLATLTAYAPKTT